MYPLLHLLEIEKLYRKLLGDFLENIFSCLCRKFHHNGSVTEDKRAWWTSRACYSICLPLPDLFFFFPMSYISSHIRNCVLALWVLCFSERYFHPLIRHTNQNICPIDSFLPSACCVPKRYFDYCQLPL